MHPRVGLSEDTQPEHADEHEERGDDQERDEQLVRTFAGTRATARTSRFSMPTSAAHLLGAGGARALQAAPWPPSATGSDRVHPAESTISHLPLIFCTLWLTPTTFTTFAVFGSM